MASGDNEVRMMMSVVPGAMTGFAALHSGLVSINNVFGSMTRSVDAQFGLVNTAIMTTGVVVAQLGMDAMDAFGKFEQGMKIVQMVSGQTAQDIDYLSQKANQFSVQYRVDIDQITEGLQTLGRAGLNSASEQAEVLENGLYTAKLEGRDLNGVLEELIQTTALLGGDLKTSNFGEQTAYVEDLMVATSMSAPITTHDVNETLKYSGGIAAAAGANIDSEEGKRILEDYMGAIAAFAQKGVTGSIAGTALRAFFNKPATQDSSVTDALGSIGLTPESLWEEDEQTMRPVSEQIGIIQDQMDNLHVSTMDRLQIWSKIVGGKMGQQMMKLDSSDIKELTSDIRSADSASSLAAGSMKTYEANLKAVGESGALLQRNVGEKLVFFANPLLEIINKVLSFANQDVMSWPLTIGIIGFIGFAGTKAMNVIRALKAELSTLVSGMQKGLSFFTQKGGIVRAGDNPIEKEKNWAAYFKAKDEYYGRTSPTGKGGGTPTTLKGFDKAFQKTITESGALSVAALKKAGLTNEQIGLAGRLSTLTKQTSLGVGEGQVWAAALKHNLVPEEQLNKMLISYKSGANGRPIADMFGIDSVIPKIKACEQALKDLGVKATLSANAINAAYKNTFGGLKNAGTTNWKSVMTQQFNARALGINAYQNTFGGLKGVAGSNWESMMARQAAAQNTAATSAENNSRSQAQSAEATEQASQTTTQAARRVVITADQMAARVFADFEQMRAAVAALYSQPSTSQHPFTSRHQIPPYLLHGAFVEPPYADPERNARIAHGDAAYRAAMAAHFDRLYNQPAPIINEPNATEQRINRALAAKEMEKALNDPTKDSARAEYYNRKALSAKLPGVGYLPGIGYQGRLPSEDAIEQSRRAKLSEVKYGQEMLEAHRQGVIAEEEILTMRRQAAAEVAARPGQEAKNAAARALSTEQDRQKFREQTSPLISARKDITDIQRQAKDDYNKNQRAAGTERDRQRFKDQNSSLITTRKEIDDIRKKSHEQWSENQKNIKKQVIDPNSRTLPTSRYYSPSSADIAAREAVNKARFAQENQALVQMWRRENTNNAGLGTNANANIAFARMFGGDPNLAAGGDAAKVSGQKFGAAFAANFSERLNRNRAGSFLSFGNTMTANGMRSATKGLSGLANKALNLTDAFGGPLMIAIMAVTAAIQLWQKAFQDYCQDLKKAGEELQNAYEKRDTAESNLRKTFEEGNPDATESEIEDMVLETYSTMNEDIQNAWNNGQEEWFKKTTRKGETGEEYVLDEEADDGSTKIKEKEEEDPAVAYEEAIKENTGALYGATAELSVQMGNYTRKMNDTWWGLDGWTGKITNALGIAQDRLEKNGGLLAVLAPYVPGLFGDNASPFGNAHGSRFSDEGEFLLTAQQKDENYSGYTEMAGLMVEDFKDAGVSKELSKRNENWVNGMRTMMGDDVDIIKDVMSSDAKKMLNDISVSMTKMSPGANAALQSSMKYDNKTWSKLGKEIAKYELKNNRSIGKEASKSTKKIEGLIQKLNSSMNGRLDRTQILQAAYLMEMQEMYQVAQNTMVPLIQQNAETAANQLLQAQGIAQETSGTGAGTSNTAAIASSIASMVSVIAMAKSGEAYYNQLNMSDPTKLSPEEKAAYDIAQDSDNAQDFIKKAGAAAYKDVGTFTTSLDTTGVVPFYRTEQDKQREIAKNQAAMAGILKNYMATAKMTVYGYDTQTANAAADAYVSKKLQEGVSPEDLYKTIAKNYQSPAFLNKLVAAYVANDEEGEGSGSGGGDGSGSDSGDKNQGTKKERVDLVLCNKKEIPKLNVNLFKKPPTFTVLNKNFKLLDVKINTEEKRKAIMASIKKAFIDVQKRSDPKIIQDEEAEYDPVAATDGNSVPSGSSRTGTNQ